MSRRDEGLDRLVDLDGFVAEVGGGFWVKIVARKVPPDADRQHGVSYSLTLHDPGGQRVFGIDNAHSVRLTRGRRPVFGRRRPSAPGRIGARVRVLQRRSADGGFLARGRDDPDAGRCRMKKTLKVGIAPRDAIVRYTRDIVAGRRRRTADDPDIWFTSVESFAKVLSERNRELLALIAERRPDSLDALAVASGRAKSNLSRTLHTMARYGLVQLEKGEGRKLKPMVTFERIELRLALAA